MRIAIRDVQMDFRSMFDYVFIHSCVVGFYCFDKLSVTHIISGVDAWSAAKDRFDHFLNTRKFAQNLSRRLSQWNVRLNVGLVKICAIVAFPFLRIHMKETETSYNCDISSHEAANRTLITSHTRSWLLGLFLWSKENLSSNHQRKIRLFVWNRIKCLYRSLVSIRFFLNILTSTTCFTLVPSIYADMLHWHVCDFNLDFSSVCRSFVFFLCIWHVHPVLFFSKFYALHILYLWTSVKKFRTYVFLYLSTRKLVSI